MEKNASTIEVLRAEADLQRCNKNGIVAAAQKLAETYRLQASKTIAGWQDLFEKAKGADAESIKNFKESLAKLPTLDDAQINSLSVLCK